MTQLFAEDGSVVPATVIKAGPCVVVQRKTAATDGYESVQIGLVDGTPAKVAQAARRPLQESQRAADARAPRGDACEGRRSESGRSDSGHHVRERRARRRHRHEPRQGVSGRRQAAPLRRRRGDPRLDVPSRARIDRRVVVSVARRQGHAGGRPHGRRPHHRAQPESRESGCRKTIC